MCVSLCAGVQGGDGEREGEGERSVEKLEERVQEIARGVKEVGELPGNTQSCTQEDRRTTGETTTAAEQNTSTAPGAMPETVSDPTSGTVVP